MEELIRKVERWAEVRKLHTADPKAQTLKAIEEFNEMMYALHTEDHDEIIDGVGDTYVTLIILCKQLGIGFLPIHELTVKKFGSEGELWDNAALVYSLNETLASSISKANHEEFKKAVHGMLLVAHDATNEVLHRMQATTPRNAVTECLQTAYNEIKDRKGMMINGTFVKYDGLTPEQQKELDK